MKELVIAADRNNLLKVQSFIDEQLEDAGCPMLTQIAIDVAVGAKERKKGGLGIYMVKNSMDDMRYEYRDGKNILTIKKEFELRR